MTSSTRVGVDDHGLDRPAVPDGQQLAGEGGGAFAGPLDGGSTSATSASTRSSRRSRISLEPRMTVSRLLKSCATPAGQAGHGAEPLGLVELLQHAPALGDVLGTTSQDPGHHPLVVLERGGRHRQREGHVVDVEPGQLARSDRGLAVAVGSTGGRAWRRRRRRRRGCGGHPRPSRPSRAARRRRGSTSGPRRRGRARRWPAGRIRRRPAGAARFSGRPGRDGRSRAPRWPSGRAGRGPTRPRR